jgi:hypothetical protein
MAKRSRLSKLRNKLMTPAAADMQRLAKELRAPGEVGRAIPGNVQAHMQTVTPKTAAVAPPVAQGRSEISTYFTTPGQNSLLYQAESWVYLNLTLIDAGPVAVGTREDLAPVLSGKGGLLVQNETFRFPVRAGQRVFLTANTVSRVRMSIEPAPYGEQILSLLASILGRG